MNEDAAFDLYRDRNKPITDRNGALNWLQHHLEADMVERAFSLLNNHADVEDVIQEVWINMYLTGCPGYQPRPGGARPYIFQIVTNKSVDFLRVRRRLPRWLGETDPPMNGTHNGHQRAASLIEAITNPPAREVCSDYYLEGLVGREISVKRGIALSAVYRLRTAGLIELRHLLGADDTPC